MSAPHPANPADRRPRSWFLRGVICGVAGVVTTVLVAWACAAWSPSGPMAPPFFIGGVMRRDGSATPFPQTAVARGFGFRHEYDKHIVNTGTALAPVLGLEADGDRISAGWPLLALRARILHSTTPPETATFLAPVELRGNRADRIITWLVDGVALPDGKWGMVRWRHLPAAILPLGFVTNSAITATALWLAVWGWRDIRSAHRAGRYRCRVCGYPLTGSGTCPECGRAAEIPHAPARAGRDLSSAALSSELSEATP